MDEGSREPDARKEYETVTRIENAEYTGAERNYVYTMSTETETGSG